MGCGSNEQRKPESTRMRCGGNRQRGAGRYPNVIEAGINKEGEGAPA